MNHKLLKAVKVNNHDNSIGFLEEQPTALLNVYYGLGCVDTKSRGIEKNLHCQGDTTKACSLLRATKTMAVTTKQGNSDFVCTHLTTVLNC